MHGKPTGIDSTRIFDASESVATITDMDTLKKYITIDLACKKTGLTSGYFRQLLRKNKLRGEKAGPRLWLIERKSFENFAKALGK
jgi:excisionase family DNA binding protein